MKHLIYLLLPILSIGINSCNVAHENDHVHENESNDKHQLNEITLHPEEAERFGVETSIVETRNFNASLKVSGEIYPSKKAQYTISATKSGIIHFNDGINLGTAVSDGAPVASISANQIIGGDDEQKAKITLENAKQEYERISALYNEKIVTEQDFLIAKENYLQALNAYKPQAETMISALSGIITAIYVNEGDYVSTGMPIASVSSSNSLTLRADLPERYASMKIETANFKPSYSDTVISIASLGGKLLPQPTTATAGYLPIIFSINNNGSILANSFAEVYLIGAQQRNAMVLPIQSLTEEQGDYFVYEKVDAECYVKHLVEIGMNNGVDVEIISGITPGMEIVTKGATIVKLASNAGAVPGHTHEH